MVLNSKYPNSVEDMAQEASMHAVHCLDQFDGRSALTTWLIRIGYNQAFDFLRKAKVRGDISQRESLDDILKMEENIANPLAGVKALENAELLYHILEKSSEHQKHILMLYHIDGYSIEEIAEMLEINENTLKVQLLPRERKREYAKRKGWKM